MTARRFIVQLFHFLRCRRHARKLGYSVQPYLDEWKKGYTFYFMCPICDRKYLEVELSRSQW